MNAETVIDVVVLRCEVGALAARTGVPVPKLLALIERQHRGQVTKPRLLVNLQNEGPLIAATRRACCERSPSED